ncbi:HNH endonuclease [Clostridium kluyveri]|uniref:AP2/ERF domain-containing protein n=1 Tax=Clostridium kluyveri TaxID=1534 RepID=A0A1L5F8R2_CLOKL|nr:AP2 domain-containing protein [Clostridium kluyveri]APM39404.1 hypothetical protein BS101_11955 [Clostridium kluyveri]
MNAKPKQIIDHIDGNGLNNCKSNLRIVTSQQNSFNRRYKVLKTSKYKGVYWNSQFKRWKARIQVDGKRILIGTFENEEDAARAYSEKALFYFKEFAKLNVIQY